MTDSPYIISNWVKDEHFYGRAEQCALLSTPHERCVYLVGTRRIGKTSLLLRLAGQLAPHAVYCDLMRAGGGTSLDEARMVMLMRRQLGAQAARSPQLEASRAAWDRTDTSLSSWLEEASWRWDELGLTITLLWDEAELLRRLPDATLMPLRAILQHSASLRIVVCASKGLADLNERWRGEYVSPFLFGFRTIYVAGLSDGEAEDLIRQRGRVQASDQTVATIRDWAGNHPLLLQSLCHRLYSAGWLREPHASDLVVDPAMADLFSIDVGYLSPTEHAILGALARQGQQSIEELQARTQLTIEAIRSFVNALAQLGMLRPAIDERWRVGNAFLEQWLGTQAPPINPTITDRASLEMGDPELQRAERAHGGAATPERRPGYTAQRSRAGCAAAGRRRPDQPRDRSRAFDRARYGKGTPQAHLQQTWRRQPRPSGRACQRAGPDLSIAHSSDVPQKLPTAYSSG